MDHNKRRRKEKSAGAGDERTSAKRQARMTPASRKVRPCVAGQGKRRKKKRYKEKNKKNRAYE